MRFMCRRRLTLTPPSPRLRAAAAAAEDEAAREAGEAAASELRASPKPLEVLYNDYAIPAQVRGSFTVGCCTLRAVRAYVRPACIRVAPVRGRYPTALSLRAPPCLLANNHVQCAPRPSSHACRPGGCA